MIGVNVLAPRPLRATHDGVSPHSASSEQEGALLGRRHEYQGQGRPSLSARRALGWQGRQFRGVLRQRHQGRSLLFRRDRQAGDGARRAARVHRPDLPRLSARRHDAGHLLRLSRPRPIRARATGIASIPTSCCSTPMPVAHASALEWNPAVFGYTDRERATDTTLRRARFSAPFMPRCVVVDPRISTGTASPRGFRDAMGPTPIIVRDPRQGLHQAPSRRCPSDLRGTYEGLGQKNVVDYIKLARRHLGRAAADPHLRATTIISIEKRAGTITGAIIRSASSPPNPRYAADVPNSLREFKEMVARFHEADLEIILDVVYNHTAEGNELGPTLSFKGIDNASLLPAAARPEKRYYINDTGTGNTLNLSPSQASSSSSPIRCATGSRRCMSTASASISARSWRARRTGSSDQSGFLQSGRPGPDARPPSS